MSANTNKTECYNKLMNQSLHSNNTKGKVFKINNTDI